MFVIFILSLTSILSVAQAQPAVSLTPIFDRLKVTSSGDFPIRDTAMTSDGRWMAMTLSPDVLPANSDLLNSVVLVYFKDNIAMIHRVLHRVDLQPVSLDFISDRVLRIGSRAKGQMVNGRSYRYLDLQTGEVSSFEELFELDSFVEVKAFTATVYLISRKVVDQMVYEFVKLDPVSRKNFVIGTIENLQLGQRLMTRDFNLSLRDAVETVEDLVLLDHENFQIRTTRSLGGEPTDRATDRIVITVGNAGVKIKERQQTRNFIHNSYGETFNDHFDLAFQVTHGLVKGELVAGDWEFSYFHGKSSKAQPLATLDDRIKFFSVTNESLIGVGFNEAEPAHLLFYRFKLNDGVPNFRPKSTEYPTLKTLSGGRYKLVRIGAELFGLSDHFYSDEVIQTLKYVPLDFEVRILDDELLLGPRGSSLVQRFKIKTPTEEVVGALNCEAIFAIKKGKTN